MPTRILLAESDDVLRASLAEQLQNEGYEVIAAGDGEAARGAVREPLAFAIIGLGEAAAALLREQGLTCPVLLVLDGEAQSAQPAILKPFRFSALLARLHGLNTHQGGDGQAVKIGPYTFHPSAKLLQSDNRKVRLTEKETNILKFLHASAGTVPRDILLHEVWGYGPAVATHTLETHIYRLRKKIEQDPARAQILLTEEGGYRLSA
ncbi:MAG TPA: response regulator transcription factor [Rhizomicrobium sp.]|jgi:DNA-binding response OmpR family regulator